MAYTAAVLDSQIDVSDIRDLLVQGDTAFPTINFTLPAGFTGLNWRVRGTFMQFNLATQSGELTATGSTTISIAWPVGSNFTTYYGEMQIVLVGTDALGNIVTKATGYVNVQRDFSISTVEVVDENLFEQLMAELSSAAVMLDQTDEQEIINGVPKLAADRVISDDHHIVDKKHVADAIAGVTADDFAHNSLDRLQGGSSTERYHMTQAQNTALHAHSNKTALDNVSGTNTGDQALPTRNSLGLDTDDTVTFANLSGTNTGDQDVSGAISTHNTDADAHADKQTKAITDTNNYFITNTVEGALQEAGARLEQKANVTQENWIAPTLINGWANSGGEFEPSGYYKDAFSVVTCRGLLKSGTVGQAAFVLPIGYRPPCTVIFAVTSNDVHGTIYVYANGNVVVKAPYAAWVSLANIKFRIA